MATFIYTARDSSGNPTNGTVSAASADEVTQLLRREGKYLTSIQAIDAGSSPSDGTPVVVGNKGIKLGRAEIIQLSTQLAIMIETGVTLSEALDCIAAQSEKPRFKALVEDVAKSVSHGTDLSLALARHPRSFPRLYVALIRAAEK